MFHSMFEADWSKPDLNNTPPPSAEEQAKMDLNSARFLEEAKRRDALRKEEKERIKTGELEFKTWILAQRGEGAGE